MCAPTDPIEQEYPLEWCDEDNKSFQEVLLEVSWDTSSNGSLKWHCIFQIWKNCITNLIGKFCPFIILCVGFDEILVCFQL